MRCIKCGSNQHGWRDCDFLSRGCRNLAAQVRKLEAEVEELKKRIVTENK